MSLAERQVHVTSRRIRGEGVEIKHGIKGYLMLMKQFGERDRKQLLGMVQGADSKGGTGHLCKRDRALEGGVKGSICRGMGPGCRVQAKSNLPHKRASATTLHSPGM